MNLIKFLKYILVREIAGEQEFINGVFITRDNRSNIIKKEYPGGLIVRYSFDILNREREMQTSGGYREITNYYSSSKDKREVTHYYKSRVWVDFITPEGVVTTEYITNK
tara:strand:+ start:864 stop:1190 length:327 start_codon:yes stop_codon:yes gene_type:complete